MTVKSCLHATCSCPVGPEDLYCTPACRRASEGSDPFGEAGCDCGHEECLGHTGKRGQEGRGRELQDPPPKDRRARA